MLKRIQSFVENLMLLSDYVDAQRKELQMQIETLPNGSIRQRFKGESCYYYHCTFSDKQRFQRYISSDEAAILAGQTHKRYLLEQSLKHWKMIQSTLPTRFDNKCIAMLENIKKLQDSVDEKMQLTLSFLDEEEKQIFLDETKTSSPKLQDNETIRLHNSNDVLLNTSNIPSQYGIGGVETLEEGIVVRSKSELIIIEQLKARGLEYYYEQGLSIDNRIFYPDFLIRHPISKDFLIWEHCGLMTSDNYFENWTKKLNTYAKQGIRPCSNLILTYEDGDTIFSIKNIRDAINYYFA